MLVSTLKYFNFFDCNLEMFRILIWSSFFHFLLLPPSSVSIMANARKRDKEAGFPLQDLWLWDCKVHQEIRIQN